MRDGLAAAGSGVTLADDAFGMVSYGGVFRPPGMRGVADPVVGEDDLDDFETRLLEAWWIKAAALSAEAGTAESDESPDIQPPDFQGRGRTPRLVQRGLLQLSKSRFFDALGPQRALLFGLRQVRLFLHDADYKRNILDTFVRHAADKTLRVVVAHSLGSIVAYEGLCLDAGWKVDTLVTFGSPLGIRSLIFDALTPRPQNGRGRWPNVKRWVNIADHGDVVALEKELGPLFGATDRLVYNGWHSHDARRYLTSPELGAAVAAAL